MHTTIQYKNNYLRKKKVLFFSTLLFSTVFVLFFFPLSNIFWFVHSFACFISMFCPANRLLLTTFVSHIQHNSDKKEMLSFGCCCFFNSPKKVELQCKIQVIFLFTKYKKRIKSREWCRRECKVYKRMYVKQIKYTMVTITNWD